MAKTEVEEQSRTLRLRKKNRKIRSKCPPILGRTLTLRPSWLLTRVKKDDKKSNYQRMLKEEDEIVILQGLIDFKLDEDEDEIGFYDFVKRSLNNEVSFYQLTEKIKSLKVKFMEKWKISVEKKPSFRKVHDRKCFELAKFTWGSDDSFKARWFEKSFLVRDIARFGMSEDLVKERWNMESTETKMRIEEKQIVLETKELKFKIEMVEQKANLLKEVTSAMFETLNNS